MRDYSERRQSRIAAPPKRPSVWPYMLLIMFLMLTAFIAGLGTGWYLYRPGGRFYTTPLNSQPATSAKNPTLHSSQGVSDEPATKQQPAQNPSQGQQPIHDKSGAPTPLTFYNTLQKGNKELMGTGINQPKEAQPQTPAKPAPSTLPER